MGPGEEGGDLAIRDTAGRGTRIYPQGSNGLPLRVLKFANPRARVAADLVLDTNGWSE